MWFSHFQFHFVQASLAYVYANTRQQGSIKTSLLTPGLISQESNPEPKLKIPQ